VTLNSTTKLNDPSMILIKKTETENQVSRMEKSKSENAINNISLLLPLLRWVKTPEL